MRRTVEAMAAEGLRVLGVAKAVHGEGHWPESQRDFPFVFLGLVGLADPIRPSVPDAVRECRSAGIRVVMITGDYPTTATAIAQQAGIDASEALTGDAIEHLDNSELPRRASTVNVFARIMPEQKLRIVQALKADGEIVAMTGDGQCQLHRASGSSRRWAAAAQRWTFGSRSACRSCRYTAQSLSLAFQWKLRVA